MESVEDVSTRDIRYTAGEESSPDKCIYNTSSYLGHGSNARASAPIIVLRETNINSRAFVRVIANLLDTENGTLSWSTFGLGIA